MNDRMDKIMAAATAAAATKALIASTAAQSERLTVALRGLTLGNLEDAESVIRDEAEELFAGLSALFPSPDGDASEVVTD